MKNQFCRWVGGVSQGIGLLLVLGVVVSGCTTTPPPEQEEFSPVPPEVVEEAVGSTNAGPGGFATMTQSGNRFAIGDLITVKFSGTIDQIPVHEERIKEDGTLTLPLIGSVQSVGKSAGDLQKDIHDRYVPDFYKRLTVVVTGEQRVYSVGGRVRSPGRQSYIGPTTVTKAIQSAGDFDDFAAKTRVELTRVDGKTFIVNCEKAAKDPSLDLPVYPGDKINVPLRDWRDIFR